MKKSECIEIFKDEIEALGGAADVQEFVKLAYSTSAVTPASFWMDKEAVAHTKSVFAISKGMMELDQLNSPIKEVVLAGVLLSDISINESDDKDIHNLASIVRLNQIAVDINTNFYKAIVTIINAHEGRVQIQGTEPKPGGPEHLVATANSVARLSCVSVEV